MEKKNNIATEILSLSLNCLELWEKGGNIDAFFEKCDCASRYRKTISSLLLTYFRNKAIIEFIITKFSHSPPPKFRRILSLALTQIYYHTSIPYEVAADVAVNYTQRRHGKKPAGFINAILRKTSDLNPEDIEKAAPEEARLNLPPELYRRWKERWPYAELVNTTTLFRKKASFCFRVIGGEISNEELEKEDCHRMELPLWADRFRFFECEDSEKIFKNRWIEDGKIYIQDPATTLAPVLLKPGKNEIILDLCSAPGGKTILMAELMREGRIIAADSSLKRQYLSSANFKRIDCQNIYPLVSSALLPPFRNGCCNAILLDVPCTNTGVARHKPDALWHFTEEKLSRLVKEQQDMLHNSSSLLIDGGRLVYSTCSIEDEENTLQVKNFLNKHSEFHLEQEKLLLPSAVHDGGYVAVLIKK